MSLANYYQVNFALMFHHKLSLAEIEEMVPYERDIYVGMIMQYLEKLENERKKG